VRHDRPFRFPIGDGRRGNSKLHGKLSLVQSELSALRPKEAWNRGSLRQWIVAEVIDWVDRQLGAIGRPHARVHRHAALEDAFRQDLDDLAGVGQIRTAVAELSG
jgi:hypothetical protein